MKILLKIILLIFISIHFLNGYKILVVNPKLGYSHVNYFSQIADILTEVGNDVTVLSIDLDPLILHPGAFKAKVIKYPASKSVQDAFASLFDSRFLWNLTNSGIEQYKMVKKYVEATREQALQVFNDEELSTKLKNENFDLGITETMNTYILGMFKVWNIKAYVTGYSMVLSDTYYKDFGLPFPASYIPNMMSPFSDKMTYLERFQNLLAHHAGEVIMAWHRDRMILQKEFDNKYGVGFFKGKRAIGDSSFIVINSNPFLDIPGPKTPKMVEVSGIGIQEPKPLNKYWNKVLSLRNQTILISFGTFAKSIYMPKDIKKGLLETVRRFKDITFIWKYEEPEDGTGEGIDNLVISKWLPQNDLLNDKRISLFITHGGIGSTTELSFRGVPAVAIPVLGDQLKNVKLLERLHTGVVTTKSDLSNPDILEEKIKMVIEDETYRRNAKLVSRRLNKRPIGSRELLIKHIEFAAEFGRLEILDLASRDMGVIEYYNLDIIIPVMIIFLSIIVLLLCLLYKLLMRCFSLKIKTD
uniref:glucuronosyltransferase n=1 Tax=Parastrongyloides trichosuri TaxID=131310 RepID=A0A0N4ZGM1_PARTI